MRLGWVVKTSGKTHAELAGLLGVHQTTLSACIRGEKCSVELIAELLECLGYPVSFEPVEGEQDVRKFRHKRGSLVDGKPAVVSFVNVRADAGSMGVRER